MRRYLASAMLLLVLLTSAAPQERFREIARRHRPTTDKVTTHAYDTMYDLFLGGAQRPLKLLEIGLGCDMVYGPGASARVWREFLPAGSEIWGAEVDAACVAKMQRNASLDIRYLVGDQADPHTLRRWINETGGGFDAIIDDGGHSNLQILTTFNALWYDALKPGGIYFIEDLQVGRNLQLKQERESLARQVPVVADVLHWWTEQLLVTRGLHKYAQPSKKLAPTAPGPAQLLRESQWWTFPLGLKYIFCQDEACALGRCREPDTRFCRRKRRQRTPSTHTVR